MKQLFLLNLPLEPCWRAFGRGRVEANQQRNKKTPARKEPVNLELEKIN